MVKLLAFLLILVILFGVEATRAFIFGTLGIAFFIFAGIIFLCLVINVYEELRDKRTPEQKKADKEKNKTDPKTAKALIVLGIFFAFAMVAVFLAVKK